MELIAKVSKGSKMDQVYLPKNRVGFGIGTYAILKPLNTKKLAEKPYFYNIEHIEPVKVEIVNQIIRIIDDIMSNYENVIITGSFLDEGFNFNDIDVIVISEDKLSEGQIKRSIEDKIKIKTHVISLNNKTLIRGLSADPLYQTMLSKCIAKKRFVYRIKREMNYKLLDLHLLKSKLLIDNFDYLDGNEKYYLVRNMAAISLYLQHKRIDKEKVDDEIKRVFNLRNVKEIKQNMLDKNTFIEEYEKVYKDTFNRIMENIKHGAKQKEAGLEQA